MSTTTLPLKEKATHGTVSFPCAAYHEAAEDYTSEKHYICKHHWHEELEILYFAKGVHHLEIGMEKLEIVQPCFCFVHSMELHSLICEGDYSESAIVFSPSMLSFRSKDDCQDHFIWPLINNELFAPRMISADHPCFSQILQYFQTVLTILNPLSNSYLLSANRAQKLTPVEQLAIKSSLLGIISVIASAGLFSSQPLIHDKRIELIKDSITYMKNHYAEKIYISDLAALANMNEQYYCRFFKKVIGKSPILFLNEIRVRRSMQLLRETDLSVVNISLECGYNNLGNYMKFFKSQTGTTPLQYRKSL